MKGSPPHSSGARHGAVASGLPGLLAAAFLLIGSTAHPAGLFLSPRGTRPLARGGAYVAGADDVGALGYNPAGIAEGQNSVLLDLDYPLHETTYTRTVTNPASGDSATYPSVTGRGVAFGPIPTLGFLHDFDLVEGLRFGAGILGDVPLLQNWPEALNDGSPAPQRYAIINYEGTVLLKSAVGLAYRLGDWVSVGATFQLLAGVFSTTMAISSCDGVACTQPENPDFDATIRVRADDVLSPGVQVGIIGKPVPWLRLGVAWESGYEIASQADLQIRMPSSPLFDDAHVDPAKPTVAAQFSLPMQLRAGIEGRYDDLVRVEAAFVWEPWSVHDSIDIDARGVTLRGMELLGDYSLSRIKIDRGFQDSWSVRLGAEAAPPIIDGRPLIARFGMFFEPSAVPDDKLTAMAVDFDKLGICVGTAYQIGSFTFEATYAYVHLFGRDVTGSSAVQINPTRPQLYTTTTIGDGSYQGSAHIFGVGASMQLGE